MTNNNVLELRKLPETAEDALICVLRRGAQELLTRAIEEEAKIFLESYERLIGENGLKQVVRNGYLPERSIQTGIGPISVKVPRVRDRSASGIKDTHLVLSRPTSGAQRIWKNCCPFFILRAYPLAILRKL